MNRGQKKRIALLTTAVMLWTMPMAMAADLSIEDAINMALAQNTSLKITQKAEETAQAQLDQAKGTNNVSVSSSDTLTTSNSNNESSSSSNGLNVSARYPLYSGGQNQANIKSADLGVTVADLTTERERESLKYDVIKAYYDALEARNTIDVRQETVDKYEQHLMNVSQLYAAGSKARIDVIRSQVELSDAAQNLIKAQNAYEVDLATLRNYVNMDRNEPLNLTTDFRYDTFNIEMPDCIDYAFRNRKDLIADKYKLQQEEQSVKAAKAGYLPSLTAQLGLGNNRQFQSRSSNSYSDSASVELSWNIFDSGVTKAKVKEAQVSYDTAKLTLQRDQENVDLSVRQAYYNMREAEKRLNSTADAVSQAEEDYYIASEKYRVGEGLMLDIIDAQEALATARLNYISAEYDYARYKAQVENEMGIGLTDREKQAAALLTYNTQASLADNTADTGTKQPEAQNTAKTEKTEQQAFTSVAQKAIAAENDTKAAEIDAKVEEAAGPAQQAAKNEVQNKIDEATARSVAAELAGN